MFVAGGIDVSYVGAADATTIDSGLVDGTVSYTLAPIDDGWTALLLRYTDRDNCIFFILRSTHMEVYDSTGGVLTRLAISQWPPPLNSPLSVTLSGSGVTIIDGAHPSLLGTLPPGTANAASTKNGFVHFGGGNSRTILSGMPVTP